MRTSSLSTARLAFFILQALGLAAVLPATGCGGNVILDGEGNTGGGGGESCVIEPKSGQTKKHVCLAECPPEGQEKAALSDEVEWDSCDEFCCTTVSIVGPICGPVMENGQCCFDLTTSSQEECMGRPFFVSGHARTAQGLARGDWALDLSPDTSNLDPEARRALASAWLEDGLYEHASIASFARFSLELLALGAPPDLLRESQRAAADEIAHAEACFGLASAYRGEPLGPSALDVTGPVLRASLPDCAEAAAREGCIGETLSALFAREALAGAEDPAVRAVLARIADDEAAHAALAWRFVAWALSLGDAETTSRIQAVFNAASPDTPVPADAEPFGSPMRAHGRLSPEERASVLRRGFFEVVRPCARALLDAHESGAFVPWKGKEGAQAFA